MTHPIHRAPCVENPDAGHYGRTVGNAPEAMQVAADLAVEALLLVTCLGCGITWVPVACTGCAVCALTGRGALARYETNHIAPCEQDRVHAVSRRTGSALHCAGCGAIQPQDCPRCKLLADEAIKSGYGVKS